MAYTYDELGRKISQTDITGQQVNYRFDKSNQLVDICNEFDQSIVKFTRDADGAIQKITHANGMWQDFMRRYDKFPTRQLADLAGVTYPELIP